MSDPEEREPPTGAQFVRKRINRGGDRVWRFDDFRDLPLTAVAQVLSRMVRAGELDRLSKGGSRPKRTGTARSRQVPGASHVKLVGPDAIAHTRRPEVWLRFSETEAALLDFLRRRGRTSEKSP